MTTPYPGYFTWPLVVLTLLVILLRRIYFDTTFIERCWTLSMTAMLVTEMLRERDVQNLLAARAGMPIALTRQIGTCGIIFAASEYLGFASSLAGEPDGTVRRRRWFYRASALACSVTMMALGAGAREAGSQIEITGGWDEVLYWTVFSIMPMGVAFKLFSSCVRELKQYGCTAKERPIALLLLAEAVSIISSCTLAWVLALGEVIGVTHTVAYRLHSHALYFWWILVFATVLSLSNIIIALWSDFGLDAASRRWRKLRPMWADLAAAFPHVILDEDPQAAIMEAWQRPWASKWQLHRAVVEIRDGLLKLRPAVTPLHAEAAERFFSSSNVPSRKRPEAAEALRNATALHGRSPKSGVEPVSQLHEGASSSAQSLEEEAGELLGLAAWWIPARQWVAAELDGQCPETSAPPTRK